MSDYPASLVVAMLSAIKRQMISDGAIRIGEKHFAGPVPDEGPSDATVVQLGDPRSVATGSEGIQSRRMPVRFLGRCVCARRGWLNWDPRSGTPKV